MAAFHEDQEYAQSSALAWADSGAFEDLTYAEHCVASRVAARFPDFLANHSVGPRLKTLHFQLRMRGRICTETVIPVLESLRQGGFPSLLFGPASAFLSYGDHRRGTADQVDCIFLKSSRKHLRRVLLSLGWQQIWSTPQISWGAQFDSFKFRGGATLRTFYASPLFSLPDSLFGRIHVERDRMSIGGAHLSAEEKMKLYSAGRLRSGLPRYQWVFDISNELNPSNLAAITLAAPARIKNYQEFFGTVKNGF